MIQAKTITFKYNPIEDRIEFILNYNNFETRLDLMMSRKLLLKFFDLSEEVFIKSAYDNNIEIDTPQQKTNPKKLDINPTKALRSHEKMVDNASIQLAKKTSLLIHKVEFIYKAKENMLVINFFVKDKIVANTTLGITQFEQIIGALMRVVPFIEWGISPNILDI